MHESGFPASVSMAMAIVALFAITGDTDNDGLPDAIEGTAGSLTDADGTQLPDLKAMGASVGPRDLFVEISAMKTVVDGTIAHPPVIYGSELHHYSESEHTIPDNTGHNHMPKPEVLKMLGDAYAAQQRWHRGAL
jgi:hypothetical protein